MSTIKRLKMAVQSYKKYIAGPAIIPAEDLPKIDRLFSAAKAIQTAFPASAFDEACRTTRAEFDAALAALER